MDFERILSLPFFHSSSHSIMLCFNLLFSFYDSMADQVLMPNMSILEMDFERIFGVPFFLSSSHSIMQCYPQYSRK